VVKLSVTSLNIDIEMDIILCHVTADFDSLGAAVGLAKLYRGSRIVLAGSAHPTVERFLRLHRDEYPLVERRSVHPQRIRTLIVADSQRRDRFGKTAEWFDLPQLENVVLLDHHPGQKSDIPATQIDIENVGATTTLVVEKLRSQPVELNIAEATVMALGIHVDTGSLTFDNATARDAIALAWLMERGANLSAISEYVEPSLSEGLQDLLSKAMVAIETEVVAGKTIAWVTLQTDDYVPGLSSLTSRLLDLTDSDALLLANQYDRAEKQQVSLIGRSRIDSTDLNQLFQEIGGGGHPKAASAQLKDVSADNILPQLVRDFKQQIPQPPTARELMSSPVRTIRPETSIAAAHRILLRYGHSGLSVVNEDDKLTGVISRRDLDIALHHGFSHAPVKGYMTTNLKTISPETTLPEIEHLMVTYDIGRLPVLDDGKLVGIVTRTDVLRELHRDRPRESGIDLRKTTPFCPVISIRDRLQPQLSQLLDRAAEEAEKRGWHLYLVGGGVRDLLLAETNEERVSITDIDLVVDGFHKAAIVGAGVSLAKALQSEYKNCRLEVHGQFQTAALLWHNDPQFDSLWIDIATARTEFYPYPAANPEVEASSIRQDLYRRDFTINALALRLSEPRGGELLDYFGGFLDLQERQIRVLHSNSFIEDPTRIYRAVRFAVRLNFKIEAQTEAYIRHAIASGVYQRSQQENAKTPALQTRLKSELKYILQAPYWKKAVQLLADLDALACIHPTLQLDDRLWWQLRLVDRALHRFNTNNTLGHWQTLLEVLISKLEPQYRQRVAANLQLSEDSIDRLANLDRDRQQLEDALPDRENPSAIVRVLRDRPLPSLILIAAKSDRPVRRKIWQYLTQWSQVKPILDGNDLKKMGYKPGPQFKTMLDDLLAATLDGDVRDRDAAKEFIERVYTQ